jgi:6-phosphogluconolactonase (cycloisomerase 2 family)/uncharacterized protein YmfQ (DUF2313 family)
MSNTFTRMMLNDTLPPGSLWEPKDDGDLDLLLEGMSINHESARVLLDKLSDVRNPNLVDSDMLSDLEREYGIPLHPTLTEAVRRQRLARLAYQRAGNGSITDMQGALDAAGFDVTVYENDPAVDPAEILAANWDINTGAYAGKAKVVSSEDTLMNDIFFKPDGLTMFLVGQLNDFVYQYSLSTAWDVITATFTGFQAYVGTEIGTPLGLTFKDDGTKMYVCGSAVPDQIYQYSLVNPWDFSAGVSYDSKSLATTTQDSTPNALFFKDDGLTMFIVGNTNDAVFQYTLSTAWDISTAVYASKTKSVAAEDTTPTGLFFKSDGTRFFVTGKTNDKIFQYSMTTPWDVSTATYDNVSLDVTPTATNPEGLFIRSNGVDFYIINASDIVTQWAMQGSGELLVNGDIFETKLAFTSVAGTGFYAGSGHGAGEYTTILTEKIEYPIPEDPGDWPLVFFVGGTDTRARTLGEFDVSNEDTFPRGIAFKTDGTKMYLVGSQDDVYQYTLETPWDVKTASYDNIFKDVSSEDNTLTDVAFKPDGTKMYIAGSTNEKVYQYSLSTPWDVSTASYDSKSLDVSAEDTDITGAFFKPDGTIMYIMGAATDAVYQYTLSTAWDVSTASYASKSKDVSTEDTGGTGVFFKDNGLAMYVAGTVNDAVFQYALSTAWDVSTASYVSKVFDVSNEETNLRCLFFSTYGKDLYIAGDFADTVYQYALVDQWTLSPVDYDSISHSVATEESAPRGIYISPDGIKLFITGGSATNDVFSYTFGTAWDLSTLTYDGVFFSVNSQDPDPKGVFFKPDGLAMFVVGNGNNTVYQYTLTKPWDLSTASYASKSKLVGVEDNGPTDLFFKPDGTIMYITGAINDKVYQYTLSTAWDVSTASYDSKFLDVSSQDAGPQDLFFKEDGLILYVIGDAGNAIYQYSLSTAWDVSTAAYDEAQTDIKGQDQFPNGLFFKSDGTKIYMLGDDNNSIYQYTSNREWDISNIKLVMTVLNFVVVDEEREAEFKKTILSIKPLHSWAGLKVLYQ